MPYYRNYTQSYEHTPEEKKQQIQQKIKESYHWYYIEPNPAPYNCHNTTQNIEVEHYTLWYTPKSDKNRIRAKDQEMLEQWFTIQEVPPIEKSVLLPHRHYCKKKASI